MRNPAFLPAAIPVLASICLFGASTSAPGPATAPARPPSAKQMPPVAVGAAWEIRLLGLDTPEKLRQLRELSGRRPVVLADVGTGGVSVSVLAGRGGKNVSIEYRMGPNFPNCDPKRNTHDTQMIRCITDITCALGVKLKVLVYQPADKPAQIARAFTEAGKEADIICFYQSYWGDNRPILAALRNADRALIISPYAETGPPTSRTPQGHAHRPWGKGIDHFVTVVPLARKDNGSLCPVSDRDEHDTEVINFVAPSFYASSRGGTCPSALVATAAACYLYAAAPRRPAPAEVISLMRQTSKVDESLIASTPPFSRATAETFKKAVQSYTHPPAGKRRKLDAPGLLNLYDACMRMQEGCLDSSALSHVN